MARGNATASGAAATNAGEAAGLFGTVSPFLTTEMIHPAGFGPTTLAAMNTAAQQSAGGSEAAAVGQGALRAMRTRNAGGASAAIASSTRGASEALSRRALGIQTQNEAEKLKQQQGAASELGNLFRTSTGAVAPDVNANTQAENASWNWARDIFDPLLGAAGSAAPTIGRAFGMGTP